MKLISNEPQLIPLIKKILKIISKYLDFKFFFIVFFYLVITNGIFFLLGYLINADRYILLLEYVWIFPLLFLKNRFFSFLFVLLYSLIFFIDVLYWVRQFFPMVTLSDFRELIVFIPFAPPLYWFFILFSFIYLFISILIILWGKKYLKLKYFIGFLTIYLFFIFFIFDIRGVNYSDHIKTKGWWGSLYETYQNLKFNRNLSWVNAREAKFSKPTYHSFLKAELNKENKPRKILFILNESWGVFHDEKVQKDISLSLVKSGSLIKEGVMKVGNGTIVAETRELCELVGDNPNYKVKDISIFKNCIPRVLKRQGYNIQSYHGAAQEMYARNKWYPDIGFTQYNFYPQLKNLERCNSFPGGCDKNIMVEILNIFRNDTSKQFIYWLTLNTHHPYSEKDIEKYSYSCEDVVFNDRQEACRNINLQKQFFDNLANTLKAKNVHELDIYIVGDHMPPLLMDRKKNSFLKDYVPFIHLRID